MKIKQFFNWKMLPKDLLGPYPKDNPRKDLARETPKRRWWFIRLLFDPRDLWIGLYWKRDCTHGCIYICILPMFPIQIRWVRNLRNRDDWKNTII